MVRFLRHALACALFLVAVFALRDAGAATTTTPVALTSSAFTDLGAGPMLLGAGGGDIVYQIADSQPAALSGGMNQSVTSAPAPLSTTAHVWARAAAASGATAFVAAGTGITVSGAAGSAGSAGSASTAGSATITSGGAAQTLFAGATPTNGFEVCNPSTTEEAWVSDSTTAAANALGSYRLGPNGGCYSPPSGSNPISAVSVIAATTGHALTARKW